MMKLIFFDIDGTLIPDNSIVIPASAVKAIEQARANGHVCMVNTGRTLKMVGTELTQQVEFDGYLYGCGTMISYHDRVLMHRTFTLEQSGRIIDGLRRHKVDAILEGCEDDYCEVPERIHTDFFRNYVQMFRKYHFDTYEVAVGKYDKMYAYVNRAEDMEGFRSEFEEELDFIDRERGFYEIVPKGYSKATAMAYMAEYLGIPMEDTVAIGDSNNDFPMFECAGVGIAMGNATRSIKEIADYVTTSVEEDGIRNALKWLQVIA